MNFIFGLFFTLIGAVLFCIYLWVPLLVFNLARREWVIARSALNSPKPVFIRRIDKNIAIFIAVIVFSMTFFTYINQRMEWMGDDNAHFDAKEYWVAGQVVLGYRSILDIFFLPDSVVIAPFICLQKRIYNQGIKHLPENDGEIGVWTHGWFVYPISKTLGCPKGTKSSEYSPKMIELLETAWTAMEQQASFPFADRQMEVQHYYRNFPGQVFYYNRRKGHYAGEITGSAEFYIRDDKMIARSKKIVLWLNDLEKKWKTSPETKSFLEAHPKIEAIKQVVCLMELYAIISNEILNGKFSCENGFVRQYLEARRAFAGGGKSTPPYQRITDIEQSKHLYNIAINTVVNRFMRYALQKYCGLKAAGEEDMSRYEGWGQPVEDEVEESMNTLFKEEIIKLEEWNNDR